METGRFFLGRLHECLFGLQYIAASGDIDFEDFRFDEY